MSLGSREAYNPPTRETTFEWTPREPGKFMFAVQAIDRDFSYSEPAMLSLIVQPDPRLISMQAELSYLRREAGIEYDFESIIGQSDGIRQVRALMERAIDSGLTVLIIGETGTGKELVAKAIHYNSPRKGHPLLDRNCGAIPRELLASDLFGHRKGAFTGATEDKMGIVPTVEVYDPATDTWTQASDMPWRRNHHTASVVDGKMYIIGGCSGTPGAGAFMSPVVDVYDPVTDTWTTAADFPIPRWDLTANVVDGKIYTIGGRVGEEADYPNFSLSPPVSTVYEYDPGLPGVIHSVSPGGKLLETWGQIKKVQ